VRKEKYSFRKDKLFQIKYRNGLRDIEIVLKKEYNILHI